MTATVVVRVLAFARLRELLAFGDRRIGIAEPATIDALWDVLVASSPQLAPLRASTRFARNGELVPGAAALRDGDEVALMPPVGGG